MRISAENSRFF